MKRFNDLTDKEKVKAYTYAKQKLVSNLVCGYMKFDPSNAQGKYLNDVVSMAIASEDREKGIYAEAIIIEKLNDELQSICAPAAEDALYIESGESTVDLGAL